MRATIAKNKAVVTNNQQIKKPKQYAHDQFYIMLPTEMVKSCDFKDCVINMRNLTIRRAGIDDKHTRVVRTSVSLGYTEEELLGEYEIEMINSDLYQLTKI